MLGSQLVTPQTGPEGVPIRKVRIEGGADIANELYLGITIDRSKKRPVIIASTEGGIEIEEVAANEPEKIHNEWMEGDGWGDGFKTLHAVIETVAGRLLKINYHDGNQEFKR